MAACHWRSKQERLAARKAGTGLGFNGHSTLGPLERDMTLHSRALERDINVRVPGPLERDINVCVPGPLERDINVRVPGSLERDINVRVPGPLERDINVRVPGPFERDINVRVPGSLERDINVRVPAHFSPRLHCDRQRRSAPRAVRGSVGNVGEWE